MNFNQEQQRGIDTLEGAVQIIANAGSGKTTVLVNRVANLVQNKRVKPEKILCVSFTRASAEELKKKLGKIGVKGVTTGTFHAICANILAQEGYNLNSRLFDYEIENAITKGRVVKPDIGEIRSFISYQKNFNKTPKSESFISKASSEDGWGWELSEDEAREYFQIYEDLKKSKEAWDFDDYLIECNKFLSKNPNKYTWDYIMVDEHQDSNTIQEELIPKLCPSGNIFVIGDFLQSIYAFRGAVPENFMNFDKKYQDATVINMNTNYRSDTQIVERANNFAKAFYGDYRHYKDAVTNSKEEGSIDYIVSSSEKEEADFVADQIQEMIEDGVDFKDIAIIYRLNSSVDYIEAELKTRKIPYHIENEGGGFFDRKEIKGILSVLRLAMDMEDSKAYEEMFSFRPYPFTFIANTVLDSVRKVAGAKGINMVDAGTMLTNVRPNVLTNLKTFRDIIYRLNGLYKKGATVSRLIDVIYKDMQLDNYLFNRSNGSEEILKEKQEGIVSLKNFAEDKELKDFIEFAYAPPVKQKFSKNVVKLMTIHRAKGLEFDNVFLIGMKKDKFPNARGELKEEARLFYVAVTRPKNNLCISQIGYKNDFVDIYKS